MAARKSSLLTAAKKAKLKEKPSRVRFAEGVLVNGTNTPSIYSSFDSCVPFMPNVLKVFLENGQTKTFKYDTTTLVQVRYILHLFLLRTNVRLGDRLKCITCFFSFVPPAHESRVWMRGERNK